MGKARRFLENLVDKEKFKRSAGIALLLGGSAFVINLASNISGMGNIDRYGLVRHLVAGAVIGGQVYQATEGMNTWLRLGITLAAVSGANFGWESIENDGKLYGTVRDSRINYLSDVGSVYLGSTLAVAREWYRERRAGKIKPSD